MVVFLLSVLLLPLAQAQFGLFPGFGFPQPPSPAVNPWANMFANPFQPFQPQQTAPPTTTLQPIESVPNPDLERGNFPLPNPARWPIGPDWNDPRNTWTSELGWGGRDVGRLISTTVPSTTTTTTTTTTTPLDDFVNPGELTDNDLLSAASSLLTSPIIRPISQVPADDNDKRSREEMKTFSSSKTSKIIGKDKDELSQMTSRQIESDRLVRHRSTSKKRH